MIYLLNFIFIIITIPLVLSIQEFTPDKNYPLKSYLLSTLLIIIIIISGIIEYYKFRLEKKLSLNKKINERNKIAKKILSHIIQLNKQKTTNYCKNSYDLTVFNTDWPYFYNVHNYLNEICTNLKFTIAYIIGTEAEYIDTSLIYKYDELSIQVRHFF